MNVAFCVSEGELIKGNNCLKFFFPNLILKWINIASKIEFLHRESRGANFCRSVYKLLRLFVLCIFYCCLTFLDQIWGG